ncbi:MAG: hypothetical protein ACOYBX_15875 [Mycobacterium sp.]
MSRNTFRITAVASALVLTVAGCSKTDQAPQSSAKSHLAPVNPYLSAPTYGITHMDSSQSDTFPYDVPRGTFHVDPRTQQRSAGGPINIMTLASTSPDYMWVSSTSGVRYVDVRDGGFRTVAELVTPGVKTVAVPDMDRVLGQRFTSLDQVRNAVEKDWGLNARVLGNGTYSLVGSDNRLYYTTSDSHILVMELVNPKDPAAGIRIANSLDFTHFFRPDAPGPIPEHTVGLAMTYDGHLVVATTKGVSVLNRDLSGEPSQVFFAAGETVSNSVAVDEKGGIYVASDQLMRKLVWTGTKLSDDSADGAWAAPYDTGQQPPSVKFGGGTGSTPTLMGFGDDADKLVVITDGSDQMKLVAFWRDQIPEDALPLPAAKSIRIADQAPVTAGLSPLPKFIQSEQSVVVNAYGAFVVNNIRPAGDPDRLVDVLAGGPVLDPPHGMQRFEWDPATNRWQSVWARGDVASTSMVPAASSAANMVMVNGYSKSDGWEVTGMDWDSGETVQRVIFGQDNLGNGAYALIQYAPNGDLLFNGVGGTFRAKLG